MDKIFKEHLIVYGSALFMTVSVWILIAEIVYYVLKSI